ncbi:hypothetical protein T484DRAFT_2960797 [Baffinella frigidus]|nr:hypothetical protein T484DRAFT_2960797 [Cryptophyta sp. CCMP2293]
MARPLGIPEHWLGDGDRSKFLVPLELGEDEFSKVAEAFHSTCPESGFRILSIQVCRALCAEKSLGRGRIGRILLHRQQIDRPTGPTWA